MKIPWCVMATVQPDWITLGLGLAGGLALFLIGMNQMTDALKALAGHRLQRILSTLSGNRVTGALTGAVSTAALQSSSVTTVLTVGFVSVELLTLTQAASVIIGANLGTTVTAQVIALNITELSLGLLALGAILWLFVSQRTWRESGRAIASLGLVFFGLQVMGEAMKPLASFEPVLDLLSGASSPWVALVIGAGVTAVIQSSSATTGIVIAMAASGLIDLPMGIAVILGANIGTCFTAVIAAIGRGRDALRTALIHVLVNLIGAIIWLALLTTLVDLVQWLNPSDTTSPRQLANAHTIFNLFNTVLFLALLTPMVMLVRRIVPSAKPSVRRTEVVLDLGETGTAALGLPAATREVVELGHDVSDFFQDGFQRCLGSLDGLGAIPAMTQAKKDDIRARHRVLIGYLRELSHSSRDEVQSSELLRLVGQVNELAHVTDGLASSFQRIARRRLRNRVQMQPDVVRHLRALQAAVTEGFLGGIDGAASPHDLPGMGEVRDAAERALVQGFTGQLDLDQYVVESDLLELCGRMTIAAERLAAQRQEEPLR
jgi:phosphate:Na+ symporter